MITILYVKQNAVLPLKLVAASYLDRIVVKIKTEGNALMKCCHGFLGAVDIGHFF